MQKYAFPPAKQNNPPYFRPCKKNFRLPSNVQRKRFAAGKTNLFKNRLHHLFPCRFDMFTLQVFGRGCNSVVVRLSLRGRSSVAT